MMLRPSPFWQAAALGILTLVFLGFALVATVDDAVRCPDREFAGEGCSDIWLRFAVGLVGTAVFGFLTCISGRRWLKS